ncbi:17497_t:CDS:1 [Gigaspora margarita]|uniref:17497_t:CDS:1 n=1 Tax=Gigaspora margarita TaxID=4874 RepID=A0ABN7WA31_GIGMA|nr:17497_t:CDS:1 [Gigaspora margarita]
MKREIYLEVYSKNKIITFIENNLRSCSMGLRVTKNDSDFIATAGHCAKEVSSPQLFYLENINYEIGL